MKKLYCTLFPIFFVQIAGAQLRWANVDAYFGKLPAGFHVFKTTDSLERKPFVAYYAIADLRNKQLIFDTDTTIQRRFTPTQFYQKNDSPLLVVNTTFFSFDTHQSLNALIKNGKPAAYNIHTIAMRGRDTFQYRHAYGSALGLSKRRRADIAWLYTDSITGQIYAVQHPVKPLKDKNQTLSLETAKQHVADSVPFVGTPTKNSSRLRKWKMQSAVGGGPVLVQNGRMMISNNEEIRFAGKAVNDKHPRTLIGYTKEQQLIVMVIQGRAAGVADGATLVEAAQLMIELGCVEAMNLDGGGSSCMLINGKETIPPSDKGQQRAVPAVFLIKTKAR